MHIHTLRYIIILGTSIIARDWHIAYSHHHFSRARREERIWMPYRILIPSIFIRLFLQAVCLCLTKGPHVKLYIILFNIYNAQLFCVFSKKVFSSTPVCPANGSQASNFFTNIFTMKTTLRNVPTIQVHFAFSALPLK